MEKIRLVDKSRDAIKHITYYNDETGRCPTDNEITSQHNYEFYNNLLSKYIGYIDNIYFKFLICQYLYEVDDVIIGASFRKNKIVSGYAGQCIEVEDQTQSYLIPYSYMTMNIIDKFKTSICFNPDNTEHNFLISFDNEKECREFLINLEEMNSSSASIGFSPASHINFDTDYFDRISLCLMKLEKNITDYPITLKGEEVYNIISGKKEVRLENGEILESYRRSKEFGWDMFNHYLEDNLNIIEQYFPEYKAHNRDVSINKLVEENGED